MTLREGSQGVTWERARSPSTKPFLVPPVSRIMLLLGLEHPHVLPPVVRLDSVYVVNHLSLLQLATDLLLPILISRLSRWVLQPRTCGTPSSLPAGKLDSAISYWTQTL